MEKCYRSTPRDIGAFLDSLYQHPLLLLLALAGISAAGLLLWRKKQAEKI